MAEVTVLSSFPFPQGKVLLSLTIIASSIFAVSETNLCTNCTASQVCCFDVCFEGPNCVGQFCHYDEYVLRVKFVVVLNVWKDLVL